MEYRYEAICDTKNYLYLEKVVNEYCSVHFHRGVELVYVKDGKHRVVVNGKMKILEKGDILIVKPFEMHSYHFVEASEIYALVLSDSYLSDFYELAKKDFFDTFLCDKEANRGVMAILDSWYENKTKSALANKGYTDLLMAELCKNYPLSEVVRTRSQDLIIEVLLYISDNYADNLTLDELSDRFCYSKYHLSKLFNQYVGINFKTYLNAMRLMKVRQIMQSEKDANLLNAVLSCGFGSMRTYYRAVKQEMT